MYLSLRIRLVIPLAMLILVDAAVTAWAAWEAADRAERQIDLQVRSVARTLTEPPTYPLTAPVLAKMKELSGAEFVLRKGGVTVVSTFATDTATDDVWLEAHDFLVTSHPLPEGHPNAGATLLICHPEFRRRSAIADAVRPPLVLGGAVAVAAGLFVGVGNRVVARVRQLQRQTHSIAEGQFRSMPVPRQHDELRDLAVAVNTLAVRLAEYERQLQLTERLRVLGQFGGGLAHQLRNAVAGARLAVQLYLSDTPTGDPEPLQVALRQLSRIESNLSQFLALGKPAAAVFETIDLNTVLSATVDLFRPQCRHTGTMLSWIPAGPAVVRGDVQQLGHLFGNVIGNAIEAAGPGGRVEVVLLADGPTVLVRDTGPGPPTHLADHLFDLFVTGKEQGIGLGLAVAKQAADAHGALLDWFRERHQTVFRITFSEARAGDQGPTHQGTLFDRP